MDENKTLESLLETLHTQESITKQDYANLSIMYSKEALKGVKQKGFPTVISFHPFKEVKGHPEEDVMVEVDISGIDNKILSEFIQRCQQRIFSDAITPKDTLRIYVSSNLFSRNPKDVRKMLDRIVNDTWKMIRDRLWIPLSHAVLKTRSVGKDILIKTDLKLILKYILHLGLITDNAGLKDDTIFNYSKNDIGVYISFLEKILEKNKNIDYDSVFDAGMTLLRKYSNQGVVYYPLRAAVKEYIAGKYDGFLKEAFDRFYDEQCEDPFIFIERTHYKRLKKIPPDLVAYIRLEGESCKSNNDKMMIISYAYGKIELIEWYIELLDTGDKKYFVPHSKEYLVSMRTQILAAIKYIMDIKIDQNRPLIDIKYPKGYEG